MSEVHATSYECPECGAGHRAGEPIGQFYIRVYGKDPTCCDTCHKRSLEAAAELGRRAAERMNHAVFDALGWEAQ